MIRARLFLPLLFWGTVGTFVLATPAASTSPTTFRMAVESVPLIVTVTGGDRQYVGQLGVGDFQVFDNGRRQPITIFGSTDVPLDLALLLDVSSSVFDRFDLVQAAARGFLASLRPEDRGTVIGFNQRLRVLAPWTNDPLVLAHGVEEAFPGGTTALYTALYIALRGMEPKPADEAVPRRRVVVVLSDGEDTGSLLPFDAVMDASQRAPAVIYTIRVKPRGPALIGRWMFGHRENRTGEFVMSTVARATGGRAFTVVHEGQLGGVYAEITAELANQYLLGYVPDADCQRGGFHSVTVLVPGRRGAVARTRTGYIRDEGPRHVAPTP